MTKKSSDAYKSISEVAELLSLFNQKTGNLSTHTLRFWEKEFKQIKPKIFSGRRRYYTSRDVRAIKIIKYLLKERGMTIKGVKNVLNNPGSLKLDASIDNSITTASFDKDKIKDKINKISKIIEEIKNLKNG